MKVIDTVFSPWEVGHCRAAYENDLNKAKRLIDSQTSNTDMIPEN
jgi:hypothetical protein